MALRYTHDRRLVHRCALDHGLAGVEVAQRQTRWAGPRIYIITLGALTFLALTPQKGEGGDHIAVPLFSYLRMATRGSGTWFLVYPCARRGESWT